MKQTAIEWLKNELKSLGIYSSTLREKCELAKEMEKEQIIEAWIVSDNPLQRMEAEKYYHITYKQD